MTDSIAFIFDMDGVIVDSNPFHKIAVKKFCQAHGIDPSDEELERKVYGRANKDWIPDMFSNLTPEQAKKFADEKEAMFRDIYKDDITLLPGLLKFLQALQQGGYKVAIATSAPRPNVDFTLDKTGTHEYFNTILDEAFVTKGKPDPQIYLKTADALGMDPAKCIVFEDSLSGVAAAQVAGCKVVALTTTHRAEEFGGTDLIIEDFRQITPAELAQQLFS